MIKQMKLPMYGKECGMEKQKPIIEKLYLKYNHTSYQNTIRLSLCLKNNFFRNEIVYILNMSVYIVLFLSSQKYIK